MMTLDSLITKFGGASKLAKAAGGKHTSIVSNWKKRGNIPFEKVDVLFKHAQREEIQVTMEQLLRLAKVRKK
jgi:hypothetical protein